MRKREGLRHGFASAAVVAAVGLVLPVLCTCASSSATTDGGASGGCPAYVSTADLSIPSVSFARDVLPIFSQHCAINGASCHGDTSVVAEARPLLGLDAADAGGAMVASTVIAGIAGVKSKEDLSMNIVTAGDPARSFLMHKIDGDQCRFVSECMVAGSYRPNCGVFMPYQAPSLIDPALRDTVRRWIAQGAQDD